jgi:hypothetical protein
MRNGDTPPAGHMTEIAARREFHISERDLRRAIGYRLVRNPIVPGFGRMIVRGDLEAFIATYGKTRPTHPNRVKGHAPCNPLARTPSQSTTKGML